MAYQDASRLEGGGAQPMTPVSAQFKPTLYPTQTPKTSSSFVGPVAATPSTKPVTTQEQPKLNVNAPSTIPLSNTASSTVTSYAPATGISGEVAKSTPAQLQERSQQFKNDLMNLTPIPAATRLVTGTSPRIGDSVLPGGVAKAVGVGVDMLSLLPAAKAAKSVAKAAKETIVPKVTVKAFVEPKSTITAPNKVTAPATKITETPSFNPLTKGTPVTPVAPWQTPGKQFPEITLPKTDTTFTPKSGVAAPAKPAPTKPTAPTPKPNPLTPGTPKPEVKPWQAPGPEFPPITLPKTAPAKVPATVPAKPTPAKPAPATPSPKPAPAPAPAPEPTTPTKPTTPSTPTTPTKPGTTPSKAPIPVIPTKPGAPSKKPEPQQPVQPTPPKPNPQRPVEPGPVKPGTWGTGLGKTDVSTGLGLDTGLGLSTSLGAQFKNKVAEETEVRPVIAEETNLEPEPKNKPKNIIPIITATTNPTKAKLPETSGEDMRRKRRWIPSAIV